MCRCCVALLAEGVDRNIEVDYLNGQEIPVALLAEGVDRNVHLEDLQLKRHQSPSSRRAWIEMDNLRPTS